MEWNLIHTSRLCILSLLGTPGLAAPDSRCRRCKTDAETASHVTSHCRHNLPAIGRRHDLILELLVKTIARTGHFTRVNKTYPGSDLRPDIVVTSTTPNLIIDLTVTFDAPDSPQADYDRKVTKYSVFGPTYSVVLGALGS